MVTTRSHTDPTDPKAGRTKSQYDQKYSQRHPTVISQISWIDPVVKPTSWFVGKLVGWPYHHYATSMGLQQDAVK
jgi:hypothetical protein